MSDGTHVRALRHAAKKLGGNSALAKRLGVGPGTIEGWLLGGIPVPKCDFLNTVEILLEYNGRPRD